MVFHNYISTLNQLFLNLVSYSTTNNPKSRLNLILRSSALYKADTQLRINTITKQQKKRGGSVNNSSKNALLLLHRSTKASIEISIISIHKTKEKHKKWSSTINLLTFSSRSINDISQFVETLIPFKFHSIVSSI